MKEGCVKVEGRGRREASGKRCDGEDKPQGDSVRESEEASTCVWGCRRCVGRCGLQRANLFLLLTVREVFLDGINRGQV